MNKKSEGFYFGNALKYALTKGIEEYGNDTPKRESFVSENTHLFAGTMLVTMFAFLESNLGSTWIKRCGGNHERDLKCLRIVRNSFVHENSNIEALKSTSHTDIEMVRVYHTRPK